MSTTGIVVLLLIIVLGSIFIAWTKTPKGKGTFGELVVKIRIGKSKDDKVVFNNYMLVDDGKSSQIDHIVVNQNGVFVIETKNYSGLIYGDDNTQEWTQVLAHGKVKNKLYNPVKQNKTHIYRLNKVLPQNTPIKSIVVMVQSNVKNIKSEYVYPVEKIRKILNEPADKQLTNEEIKNIVKILEDNNNKEITNREHVKEIKEMKKNIDDNICPRCGGKLVLRDGKYGKFYGCENYPKCKFIKKI